jgi:hypothetical protein
MIKADAQNLRRAADLHDAEAQTWRDGYCVKQNGKWVWPETENEFERDIETRVQRLETSSRILRGMADKIEAALAVGMEEGTKPS